MSADSLSQKLVEKETCVSSATTSVTLYAHEYRNRLFYGGIAEQTCVCIATQ